MSAPIRLGILSTAHIAHGFVEGLKDSSMVEVVAVASRTLDAARAFASRHGIGRAHGSYDALLADAGIDAIYNPLPNSMHALWSAHALRAGKHVLCEKPLTVGLEEAASLFALSHERSLVLLEAYPYRYQPQTLAMRRLIAEGAIGEVRLVQSSFGFSLAEGANIRLEPDLGGGAVLDAGCYAVSLAQLAIGRRALAASALARWASSGVDLELTGTIRFDGGATAQIACSMDTAVHRHARIIGSAGTIETDYLNHTSDTRPGRLRLRQGRGWDVAEMDVPFERGNGFRFEAERFATLVHDPASRAHDDARTDTLLSLQNMATLQALAQSARGGKEVAVAEVPSLLWR